MCMENKPQKKNEASERSNDLVSCGKDLLTCGNDLLSCGNEIKKMKGKLFYVPSWALYECNSLIACISVVRKLYVHYSHQWFPS